MKPVREEGWYWVRRNLGIGTDETYWSIMLYSADVWLVSGCEMPIYQDSDFIEISERIKSPEEQAIQSAETLNQ